MKIQNFKIETIPLKLIQPITVTFGTIEEVEALIIQIETDEGIHGIGEGAPFAPVTGETLETAIPTAKQLCQSLVGKNPLNIEKIHHQMDDTIVGHTSVKAAIDIALHDILGKKAESPLYQLLGGYHNAFENDMTLGIDTPENMAHDAKRKVEEGFRVLKLKAGINVQEDIKAVKAIRKEISDDIRLRVDANQGWTAKEALQYVHAVEPFHIDAIEQPLPYWNIKEMAFVRRQSPIPIMADETVHSPQDAIKVFQANAADIINIKLMKSGGLYKAQMINGISEAAGLQCMVGCMLESKIGITAGASIVAAKKNITEADMDSFLHVKDPGINGGITIKDGIITLPEAPGLGIDMKL